MSADAQQQLSTSDDSDARDRICPVLAGSAMIRGGRMIVRLPMKEAEIEAPASLLNRLFAECDGQRPLSDIAKRAMAGENGADFIALVDDLMRQGILVDAGNWLAQASQVAQRISPWGQSAAPEVWLPQRRHLPKHEPDSRRIRPKSTQLARLLRERASAVTFDDIDVDEETLAAFLWAMYGVTRHVPARRAVASGGAFYCLEFYLVLLRPIGNSARGTYRCNFAVNGDVGLRLVSQDIRTTYRAFTDPHMLEHATGFVVIAADIRTPALKYRNRAYPYVLIEAGKVTQNAALVAPELGLAMRDIGGFEEEHLATLCRLTDEAMLATIVFGAAPTTEQIAAATRAPEIEFTWYRELSGLPLYMARARVADHPNPDEYGWGRDADPKVAYLKALGEGVERYSYCVARDLVSARIGDLSPVLDPRSVVSYSKTQYRGPTFPFREFDPTREHLWKKGHDRLADREIFALADCIYVSIAFDEDYRQKLYTHSTSSGCAAGTSCEEAGFRATIELIERDLFMRHWFSQRGGIEIVASSLPPELSARVARLLDAGCRVSLQELPSPFAYVYLALIQHGKRHFTCAGAGASLDLLEAAHKALSEAEIQAHFRLREDESERLSRKAVRTPHDHAALYAQAAYFRRADALFNVVGTKAFGHPTPKLISNSPDMLYAALRDTFESLVFVDISAPGFGLGQGRQPIYVVRALVPGLIPIAFGYGRLPLGMVERPAKAALFPHPFP